MSAQPSLFDIQSGHTLAAVPFSNGSTSKDAANALYRDLPRLERKVYLAIAAAGGTGLTCDEAEQVTALPHTTCSARINGLVKRGRVGPRVLIRDSGLRRKTSSGRNAIVWVVA